MWDKIITFKAPVAFLNNNYDNKYSLLHKDTHCIALHHLQLQLLSTCPPPFSPIIRMNSTICTGAAHSPLYESERHVVDRDESSCCCSCWLVDPRPRLPCRSRPNAPSRCPISPSSVVHLQRRLQEKREEGGNPDENSVWCQNKRN